MIVPLNFSNNDRAAEPEPACAHDGKCWSRFNDLFLNTFLTHLPSGTFYHMKIFHQWKIKPLLYLCFFNVHILKSKLIWILNFGFLIWCTVHGNVIERTYSLTSDWSMFISTRIYISAQSNSTKQPVVSFNLLQVQDVSSFELNPLPSQPSGS